MKVVPIFAHIPMAIEAGKLIRPPSSAVSTKIPSAPLDWIARVAMIPKAPNHRKLKLVYFSSSKVVFIASILSFIKCNPKKRKPNHMRSFAP